jgi:hypothetical protein
MTIPHSSAETSPKVQDAIDAIVLLCVAGGTKVEITASGDVEGGIALKRFGISGGGDIKFSRTEVRGLVKGLQGAMSKIAGQQASEARDCMKPYIDKILNKILGESSGTKFYLKHKIEFLLTRVEGLSVSKNGNVVIRMSLNNVSEEGKGLAIALKAKYSDGIADFWKFFPRPLAQLTDEVGNDYRLRKITPIGFARDQSDWTIIRAGQSSALTASFTKTQNGAQGRKFDISIPIRLARKPEGESTAQVSSFEIYLRGIGQ